MKLTSTKRPKKQKLPPSYEPHQCVVLAFDTAQVSGWALFVEGALQASGEIDLLRQSAVDVCRLAVGLDLPAVMVFERPFRGTTQGAWIGAVKAAWVAAGGRVRAMVGCYPATFRARVLGSPSMPRAVARAAEQRVALQQTGGRPVGPDAAAAICLGLFAIRAGEVGKVLPKRRKVVAA